MKLPIAMEITHTNLGHWFLASFGWGLQAAVFRMFENGRNTSTVSFFSGVGKPLFHKTFNFSRFSIPKKLKKRLKMPIYGSFLVL